MTVDDLPPLPKPAVYMHKDGSETWLETPNYASGPVAYWNASQLRAAIAQAVERERALQRISDAAQAEDARAEIESLRAQVARLTADAERYKLVRDHDAFDIRVVGYGKRSGKLLDDLADAILTTKEQP